MPQVTPLDEEELDELAKPEEEDELDELDDDPDELLLDEELLELDDDEDELLELDEPDEEDELDDGMHTPFKQLLQFIVLSRISLPLHEYSVILHELPEQDVAVDILPG